VERGLQAASAMRPPQKEPVWQKSYSFAGSKIHTVTRLIVYENIFQPIFRSISMNPV
jgi:hypothetical protein